MEFKKSMVIEEGLEIKDFDIKATDDFYVKEITIFKLKYHQKKVFNIYHVFSKETKTVYYIFILNPMKNLNNEKSIVLKCKINLNLKEQEIIYEMKKNIIRTYDKKENKVRIYKNEKLIKSVYCCTNDWKERLFNGKEKQLKRDNLEHFLKGKWNNKVNATFEFDQLKEKNIIKVYNAIHLNRTV